MKGNFFFQFQERQFQLGCAHEVQRCHRDVDETKDWTQEKDEALNNDHCGKDLARVSAGSPV